MKMSSWWRRWAMLLAQTQSAAYFEPPTAGRPGLKFCPKTKTLAGLMSFSIPTIRTLFSLRYGRRDGSHGFSQAAGREVGSIDLKTMESPGNVSREMDFPTESSERSA